MRSAGALLPKLGLSRPVTVLMVLIALIVVGVIAYTRIPLALLPSGYQLPFLYVRIHFPNSTPKEVDEQIVRPVGDSLSTVKGITRIRSWAGRNSGSFGLELSNSVSVTEAYNQIQDRLQRLMPSLPEGVDRYYIWKWDPNDQPIMAFGFSYGRGKVTDPYHVLDQQVVRKVRRLPGVSRVTLWGSEAKRIVIEVSQSKLRAHGIGIYSLVRTLRQDNLSLASGKLREGSRVFFVRSNAKFRTLRELREYPVAQGVRLKHVANIRFGAPPEPMVARINRRFGAFLRVYKEAGANSVALCRRVQKEVRKALAKRPELRPFKYHLFFSQGQLIEESMSNLRGTLGWGGMLAVMVLLIFLRRIRLTLMVVFAIPASLLFTLCAMYFSGESLNVLTLTGLMLSVGMVVDNSIVVLENISRHRQAGADGAQASLLGAGEVALAILMATSTTIAVFVPLMLMSGSSMLSFYLRKVGFPVCVSLAASLVVALAFIPLGAKYFGGSKQPRESRLMTWLSEKYAAALAWALRHRFDAVLVVILIFATIKFPAANLKKSHEGATARNSINLRFFFPSNYKFKEKNSYLKRIEARLLANRKKWSVRSFTLFLGRRSRAARLQVYLNTVNTGGLPRKEVVRQIKESLPWMPGVDARLGWRRRLGRSDSAIKIHIYGRDSERLEKLSKMVEKHLRSLPGVDNVEADLERDSMEEIRVGVRRLLASRMGLDPLMVGGAVAYTVAGRRLRDFRLKDKRVPIWIRTKGEDRTTVRDLEDMPLTARQAGRSVGTISMGQLVGIGKAKGPTRIRRVNRKTHVGIKIYAPEDDLGRLYVAVDAAMKRFPMPPGYSWSKGRRYRDMRKANRERNTALILAVTFVFLLMGLLFESFLLPFCIVLSVPFHFLGGIAV